MTKIELQFLQKELDRVNEWIHFSDKKGAFLASFYSIIFGILLSQKERIMNVFWGLELCQRCLYILLFLCLIVVFFAGISFLLLSIFPKLNINIWVNWSLFYFWDVAKTNLSDYTDEVVELSEEKAKIQMAEQIYINSLIAQKKMENIQKSIRFLVLLIWIIFALSLF